MFFKCQDMHAYLKLYELWFFNFVEVEVHLFLMDMCGRFWLLDRHVVRMLMVDLLQIVMCVWSEKFAHLWTISAVDCHNHLCWFSAYLLHCLATIVCVRLNPMIYAAAMLLWLLQICFCYNAAHCNHQHFYESTMLQYFKHSHCHIATLVRSPSSSCHQPPQYPSSGLCRQLSKWPLWHTSVSNKSDAQLHNSGFGSTGECSLCNVLAPPWSKNVCQSECDSNTLWGYQSKQILGVPV